MEENTEFKKNGAKPDKTLIAISALGNHGKTTSATKLVGLLTSPSEGWTYDGRSVLMKKEQLAILQKDGVPQIAIVTIGDCVDQRFKDWYNIIKDIPTIKIIVGCCRTKHGTFDYLCDYARKHQFTMVLSHPYYQQVPALPKGSPIADYWNDIYAKHLLELTNMLL